MDDTVSNKSASLFFNSRGLSYGRCTRRNSNTLASSSIGLRNARSDLIDRFEQMTREIGNALAQLLVVVQTLLYSISSSEIFPRPRKFYKSF